MAAPDIKPDTDTLESSLATLFAEVHASLPGPTWLEPLRTEAMARVARDGFPHKRIEAWKYTDLRNKLSAPFTLAAPATADTSAPSLFEALSAYHIDAGAPSRGDEPDGLEIINLADALATPAAWLRPWLQPGDDALRNLNLAFAATGTLIRVGAGVKVKRPIALRSLLNEAGVMTNARSVIMLEEGAELTLVELDEGEAPGQSLANLVTSITLERGAHLKHLRLTAATGANVIIRNHDIEIAKDASYESVLVSSGTELVRHQTTARLTGEGANFDVACAYAASADEHTDLTFAINHDAPHTTSRLLTKGVAAGHGHAVIQGRVVVRPEAQKTDSHQLSRALLLSSHAEIDQKPELEIFADDVKCGHGAAVGALDQNQLFYLRTRGIPEREARNMLIAAFLGEVTERVPHAYRAGVETWLADRMAIIGGAPA